MNKKRKSENKEGNKFLIFSIIVFVIAAVFGFLTLNKGEDLYFFTYKPFVISTGSMEPEYKTNSIVIIKQGGYDKVKVGDVISFRPAALGGAIAFHRVIEITDSGFVTKGDNNENPDSQVITKEEYIGKEVFHTNITAGYITVLKSPGGIFKAVILPVVCIMVLTFLIKSIIRLIKGEKLLKRKS